MAEITGYSDMLISYGGVDIPINTKDYKIDEYKQDSLKFEFEDQYNIQYLYKKGNRWVRKIIITQTNQTDDDFKDLAIKLMKMCGKPVTLTPHIDEPTNTQLTWLISFWDRYNDYPVEKIVIDLQAVDID
jgi:uncharacterized membrane protein